MTATERPLIRMDSVCVCGGGVIGASASTAYCVLK